jgi:hypothetical protein
MKYITAADSINALAKIKKTIGGVKFRGIMGIRQRQTTFPVETRSVKLPNHNNTKIIRIQFFF